jgi:hypothetical protein
MASHNPWPIIMNLSLLGSPADVISSTKLCFDWLRGFCFARCCNWPFPILKATAASNIGYKCYRTSAILRCSPIAQYIIWQHGKVQEITIFDPCQTKPLNPSQLELAVCCRLDYIIKVAKMLKFIEISRN